ncbi:hypothetical protein ACFE04_023865 [Oxalis oulophora]
MLADPKSSIPKVLKPAQHPTSWLVPALKSLQPKKDGIEDCPRRTIQLLNHIHHISTTDDTPLPSFILRGKTGLSPSSSPLLITVKLVPFSCLLESYVDLSPEERELAANSSGAFNPPSAKELSRAIVPVADMYFGVDTSDDELIEANAYLVEKPVTTNTFLAIEFLEHQAKRDTFINYATGLKNIVHNETLEIISDLSVDLDSSYTNPDRHKKDELIKDFQSEIKTMWSSFEHRNIEARDNLAKVDLEMEELRKKRDGLLKILEDAQQEEKATKDRADVLSAEIFVLEKSVLNHDHSLEASIEQVKTYRGRLKALPPFDLPS